MGPDKVLKIAIASGKGGTGKTTVAVNLFHFIRKQWTEKVQLIDCDVEEPNDALFFSDLKVESVKSISQMIPEIDPDKCTFCRKCVEYCEFNAIVVIPPVQFAEINPSLCHSCGACSYACKDGAISEYPNQIGQIRNLPISEHSTLLEGSLNIGSAMQTPVIQELKKEANGSGQVLLYDSPPGTSCPVVTTVADADYTLLVSEPTPFGLYDLKLMVELLKDMNKKYGVILNKTGIGNTEIYDYLDEENLELLAEIPFSREYAANYAAGKLLSQIPESIEHVYQSIIDKLKDKLN
jgi:MinD superfamily P-loop ATPase